MKHRLISQGRSIDITILNNKVVKYEGDKALIMLFKPYFTKSITASIPEVIESVIEDIRSISHGTKIVKLKPGDEHYIDSILFDKKINLEYKLIYNMKEE